MCGIAGIYSLNSDTQIDKLCAFKMQDYLAHRGPDDRGLYCSNKNNLYLINTRLSIIDLTVSGHQPMSDKAQEVWISFNGEIYNYAELRDELKKCDYEFRSSSDTEVILNGYKEWGIDGLIKRLRGMFAFALYDLRCKPARLILCRDRLGIKPLYYYQDDSRLIFASEVGAIVESGLVNVRHNNDADIAFLFFGYIPAPLTTLKNVVPLSAGSYLEIDGANSKTVKYYDLLDAFKAPKKKSSADIYDNLKSILDETVRMHLVSEAPLGIFLSGGLDSSVLAGLAGGSRSKDIITLGIVFDEQQYDESVYQKMVSARYSNDHRQVKLSANDFYSEIDNIFKAMDQPTCDGVNTYFIARAAKEAGLKTVLSGLGADEIFCGYNSFKQIRWLKRASSAPKKIRSAFNLMRALDYPYRKLSYLGNGDDLALYLVSRGFFTPEDISGILDVSLAKVNNFLNDFKIFNLDPRSSVLGAVDWLSYMEMNFYLRDQLLKDTDFMSMHHSVEVRVPYLDSVLTEFVIAIDSRIKMDDRVNKPLLAKSVKGMLPEEIISRKKHGFTFPFDPWIRGHGRQLLSDSVSKSGINKKCADHLWGKFERHAMHWSRIWALIVMGNK